MRVAPEIVLTSEEQAELARVVKSKPRGSRLTQRARIVLLAARGMQNKDIAEELSVGRVQVARWRERYMQFRFAGIERDLPRGAPSAIVDVQKLVRMTTKSRPDTAIAWTTRTMAVKLGISPASVSRHWRANGLAPHAAPGLGLPLDLQLAATLEDVVGLWVAPGRHALVLCCAETMRLPGEVSAQARAAVKNGRAATRVSASQSRDTAKLLAMLNMLDREATGTYQEKEHSHLERLRFLRRIDRETSKEKALHLFTEDGAAYEQPGVQKWLAIHPRFNLHFTPASTRWIDHVERFLGNIKDKIPRDGFASVPKLIAAIEARSERPAAERTPFIWTRIENEIRQKAVRGGTGSSSSANSGTPTAVHKGPQARESPRARMSGKGHLLREHVTNLKRDRILQEAAQLFFERGYLQTSVDAIAERLGATKPFVYYHFQSKVDILVEICERSNRDALAAAESANAAEGSPSVRLEKFLREFTNIALQQHQLVAIYFREAISLPPAVAERINQMRKLINRRLNALLSEGINSGDFQIEDPRIGALVIAGMSSYAFAWYRENGRLSQAEVTNRIVQMALKLVSASPYHRPSYRVHSVIGV